jgi:hypothetical protein
MNLLVTPALNDLRYTLAEYNAPWQAGMDFAFTFSTPSYTYPILHTSPGKKLPRIHQLIYSPRFECKEDTNQPSHRTPVLAPTNVCKLVPLLQSVVMAQNDAVE